MGNTPVVPGKANGRRHGNSGGRTEPETGGVIDPLRRQLVERWLPVLDLPPKPSFMEAKA